MKRLVLLLTFIFFNVYSQSKVWAKNLSLTSFGISSANSEVTGSGYKASSTTTTLVAGNFDYFLSANWRFQVAGQGTFDGDNLTVSTGVGYHFLSLRQDVHTPVENVDYVVLSGLSPYIGVDLGFTRVQLSLNRTDTEFAQTDAVIGGLIGPILRLGTFYTLNEEWLVKAEVSTGYAFSSSVASSTQNIAVFLSYILP